MRKKLLSLTFAAALVSLFASNPAAFGFDVTTIVTRAGDEAALKLSVTDVKLNAAHGDKGWVDISVSSNFGALSAADKAKTYSAALVIKVKQNGAALSSPFYTVCLPD